MRNKPPLLAACCIESRQKARFVKYLKQERLFLDNP